MKRVKRILAAVTAAAMVLLIAPELGGEVFSQVGELMQNFAVSVSAEEGEAAPVESEPVPIGSEPVQSETDTDSAVTDDMTANDGIAAQSDVTVVASGKCGDNVTWTLDSNDILTINGTGRMFDYGDLSNCLAPWSSRRGVITKIIINNGVTSIAKYAFYNCTNLTSITIPDSVTSIGSAAFNGCTSLTSVTIPNSVTRIYNYAFFNCAKLTSITIPDSVISISELAFCRCESLTNITIPDSVTFIGWSAFKGCTSLTSITIPDGVTSISESTFQECTSLTSITISDSITSIGGAAFDCTNLNHIHIPSNKTYSDYAGQGELPSEPSYYFPGGCGDPNCPLGGGSGTDISAKSGKCGDNAYWKLDSGSGYNEDPGYDCVLTISGSGDMYDYSLDSSNCAPWYSYKEKIKFIIIEDGITGIGASAFAGCKAAENIYFPSSVKKISDKALLNCTALKTCIIENGQIEMSSSMLGYSSSTANQSDKKLISGLTVYSRGGNMPEFYAKQNKIAFEKIYFPGEFVDFRGTVLEKKGSGMDSGMEYISHYFLQLENNVNFYNNFSNLVVLGTSCAPIIKTNVVAISEGLNVSLSDYVDKIVLVTGDLFIAAEEFILNECGFDPCIGNCTIVENTKSCIVKWYNGETLLETQECPEKTIPEFKGTVPSCYDDEYGLKREFLGWTTKNNIDYDIHIPEIPGPIKQDTNFYAVFSEKDPEVDISDEEADKIKYINEHMNSAKRKEWNVDGVKYSNDFRFDLQNGATETAHYIWRTVQMTDKSVNLDILGIVDEIRANDYNAIMLDMFNSIEGYEAKSTFFNEAENKALKDIEDIIMGWGKYVFSNEIKYQTELRKELDQFDSDRDVERLMKAVDKLCEKTGLSNANCIIPKKYVDLYNLSDKVFTKVNLSLETIQDVIKNSDKIAAYRMYQYMSNEYKDILVEMYYCADNIPNSDWEVKHLKEAIAYALNYYYNTEEQAANDFIINIIGKNVYKLGMKKTVQDFFKNGSEKFIDKALASDTAAGSSKLNGSLIIAAVQNGFKFGVKISDLLFESSNREDIYVKVKEFGVLSKTLQKALDERASELFSAATIDDQYAAAKRFDKAFKMFMYIEAAASDNISDYENTFEKTQGIKAANTALVGPIFSLIINNQYDKKAAKHVENAAIFTDHARFVRRLCCHNNEKIENDKIAILSEYGGKLKEHKVIIVSCPVQMNVYDENHLLVGLLSKENSNVTKGYEDYIYRVEETDSCVACIPMDYTVEIIGLDNGTMKVIGSYYSGKEQESTFSYNNVPISPEYRSTVIVDVNKLELITTSISPSQPSAPSNPSTDNSSNQGSSTINSTATASTSFNVKLENKITGKSGKAKAIRTDKNVTINVGKENNGYYANIYDTNGNLIDSVKIKNGKIKFTIPPDTNFYIVIDKDSHLEYEDVSSGAGIYELFEEKKEPFCTLIIVITALGFLFVALAKRYQKNKH